MSFDSSTCCDHTELAREPVEVRQRAADQADREHGDDVLGNEHDGEAGERAQVAAGQLTQRAGVVVRCGLDLRDRRRDLLALEEPRDRDPGPDGAEVLIWATA